MIMTDKWNQSFVEISPIFDDIKTLMGHYDWSAWPNCETLMSLIQQPFYTLSQHPVYFYPQDDSLPDPDLYYEDRIFKTGVVSTRQQNWHDFFNAVIWMQFPRIKALINALHISEFKKQGGKKRTALRDALTLFDECGVIVVAEDEALLQMIRQHEWKTLFWDFRNQWHKKIQIYVLGHANYEKALNPYVGLTAKVLLIHKKMDFFSLDRSQQIMLLDQEVAADDFLYQSLLLSGKLKPLPLLGVPGWYPDNNDACFYNNTEYFRPLSD